jgi:hypothetical protein
MEAKRVAEIIASRQIRGRGEHVRALLSPWRQEEQMRDGGARRDRTADLVNAIREVTTDIP